jgi:benzoyl-CoA reductase/2-hydroxyglutaryl-CoA dehydratase subunit BcrC/BadD/HgdB
MEAKADVDRRLKSFGRMRELMTAYYLSAKDAENRGQKVAWVTSGAPVEFLHAMGVIPIYPENHAAMCAASKMAVELQQAAEDKGYSMDLCSYARTDIGSILTGKSPVLGLPRPDFMVACNNICTTVVKWYEVVSRFYQVPVFLMDMPFLHRGLEEPIVDYVSEQMTEYVRFLEDRTGTRFDGDRFLDVLRKTVEATELWKGILDTCTHVPAPMSCFDAFVHIAPIVTLRGTQACTDYYRILKQELEERVAGGVGAVPEERHRLLWDNLPIWFNLRGLSEKLAEWKACLVAATYADSWCARIYPVEASMTTETLFIELAKAYLVPYINSNFAERVRLLQSMIERYRANGFLMHSDRSCKPYSLGQYVIRDEVTRATGVPGLVIEADMNDARQWAEGPTLNRIQAYLESLEVVRG